MNHIKNIKRLSVMLSRSYMASSSNILKLKSRGLLQAVFPDDKNFDLESFLTSSKQTVYCGFDPTSESLHLGNLLSIMVLLHCQRGGHNPIALVGGATAFIGDPSDKLADRPTLKLDDIEKNCLGIKEDVTRIFNNYQKYFHVNKEKELSPIKILNNGDWYKNIRVVDFIGTTARFFRMGDMLNKIHVKRRLESEAGMCLAEFTYPIFQAYDWLHLHNKHDCNIQIGGSDQMGNIVSGYELLRKVFKTQFYGLTTPLITNSHGNKLGKSEGNTLYLNPEKTSPFELYQFFVRLPDVEVEKYLKLYTFFSEDEIIPIVAKTKTEPEKRIAQKILAKEVVKLVHGEEGVQSALACTDTFYNTSLEKLANLKKEEVKDLFKEASLTQMYFEPGMKIVDIAMKANYFKTIGDAKRIIRAGGFQINTIKVTEPEIILIPAQHILRNKLSVIRIGKKNYHIIQWMGMDHEKNLLNQLN